MTNYTDKLEDFSRRPCKLLVITGHRCALTFGQGACESTLSAGSPNRHQNAFFVDWTGDNPDDFSVSSEDANNYVTQFLDPTTRISQAIMVSDSSAKLQLYKAGSIEAGKVFRYKISFRDFSGTVKLVDDIATGGGSRTVIDSYTTSGVNTGTFTATNNGEAILEAIVADSCEVFVVEFSIWEEVPGTECRNTWPTCKDRVNFDDETYSLKFTSFDANLPFNARPYLQNANQSPTVIQQKISSKSRTKYTMVDEKDGDIGIDPYFSTRESTQGSYWKKFLAWNSNYAGWTISEYAGFVGLDENDFEQRWIGQIENITRNGGAVVIDAINTMVDLDKKKYPDNITTKLLGAITDIQTTFSISSVTKEDGELIDASGYIKIDDEIIYYDSFVEATGVLNDCEREQFSTTGVAHSDGTRASLITYFAPDNPFDILQSIWIEAGGVSGDLDTAEFAYWKDWPVIDLDFSAIVSEDDDVTASTLFWEIVNLLDCHVWQNERQKITIRRNLSNEPDREYTTLTDDASVIHLSGSGDYNEPMRKTRVVLYWGLDTLGDYGSKRSFADVDAIADPAYEEDAAYGKIKDEILFSRWFSKRFLQEELVEEYANGLALRRLLNRLDPRPIIAVSVERKDEELQTGEMTKIITDEILDVDGNPSSAQYLIISRKDKKNKIELRALRLPPNRFCFIAPDDAPDYDDPAITDADKEYGYIGQGDGTMPNGDPEYHIY